MMTIRQFEYLIRNNKCEFQSLDEVKAWFLTANVPKHWKVRCPDNTWLDGKDYKNW